MHIVLYMFVYALCWAWCCPRVCSVCVCPCAFSLTVVLFCNALCCIYLHLLLTSMCLFYAMYYYCICLFCTFVYFVFHCLMHKFISLAAPSCNLCACAFFAVLVCCTCALAYVACELYFHSGLPLSCPLLLCCTNIFDIYLCALCFELWGCFFCALDFVMYICTSGLVCYYILLVHLCWAIELDPIYVDLSANALCWAFGLDLAASNLVGLAFVLEIELVQMCFVYMLGQMACIVMHCACHRLLVYIIDNLDAYFKI